MADNPRPLTAAMVLAPLLLMAGTAVTPSAVGDRISGDRAKALAQLDALDGARGQLLAAALLVTLGLAALVPAAFALGARARWSRLAVTGWVLVTLGAPAGAAVNVASDLLGYQLTAPSVPRSSAADVRVASSGQGQLFVLYLLALLGMLLLAVAVWRAGAAWWHALLVGGGTLVGFGAPEGPTGAAFTLPLLVGLVLLARDTAVRPSAVETVPA